MSSSLLSQNERRLLLVDDDPMLLRALRRQFENEGWRVYPATGVHDAMRVLTRFQPKVALVDVCMPEGGAMGFFAQANAQNRDIPTVLMSGSEQVRKLIEQKLKGTVRFIDKPFDIQVALAELAAALAAPSPKAVKAERDQLEFEKRVETVLTVGGRTSNELPVLDPTLAASLPIFQRETTSTDAVVKILGRDAAASAAVIRMANSGYFKGSRAIGTLEDACIRIGMQGVSEVIHAVAVVRAFEIQSSRLAILGKRLFENVNASARLARTFAQRLPALEVNPSEAYLSTLLHNVGEAAGLFLVDRRIDPEDKRKLNESLLAPYMREHHEAIGSSVFSKWGLPAPLIQAASSHHGEMNAQSPALRRVMRVAYEIACRTRFHYAFAPDLPTIDLRTEEDAKTPEDFERIASARESVAQYARWLETSPDQLLDLVRATFAV